MKKTFQLSTLILLVTICFSLFSCSENDVFEEPKSFETAFRVYECNENFEEGTSIASRYVSDGATITIWKPSEGRDYNIVDKFKTGMDGMAIYAHNDDIIYYSVEKEIDTEDGVLKKNLASIMVYDGETDQISIARFQVEGVYTSQEDIDTHAKFNINPVDTEYIPHIGALKFKDINKDGFIDIKDSAYRAKVNTIYKNEEIVYIITETK